MIDVLGENRQISMSNGQFQDSFSGYGVHLYQLAAARPNPPTNLTVTVN
jgi:hypothetical protein